MYATDESCAYSAMMDDDVKGINDTSSKRRSILRPGRSQWSGVGWEGSPHIGVHWGMGLAPSGLLGWALNQLTWAQAESLDNGAGDAVYIGLS